MVLRVSLQVVELVLYGMTLLLQLSLTEGVTCARSLSLVVCAGQPVFSAWYLSHYRVTRSQVRLYTGFRVQTFPSSVLLLVLLNCVFPSAELIVSSLCSVMLVGLSGGGFHRYPVHTMHSVATNTVLVVLLDMNVGLVTFIFIVTCCIAIILYDTRGCFSASEYILVSTFLTLTIYKTIFDPSSSCVVVALIVIGVFLVLPPRLDANSAFMVLALLYWFGVIFYKNKAHHFHRLDGLARDVYADVCRHTRLVLLWLGCMGVALGVVIAPSHAVSLAVSRKLFHALICLVYTTGLLHAPYLLGISALAVAIAMVFCEIMYHREVPWLKVPLSRFAGSQDCGSLVLTPLFLLLGLSVPVWWRYGVMYGGARLPLQRETSFLRAILPFAGIFTIGVGDSLAALVGHRYGRHKFPLSPKTLEGALANAGSQAMFIILLAPYLVWGSRSSLDFVLLVATVLSNALLEVYLRDIDNLLVPLYTTLTLHCFDSIARA